MRQVLESQHRILESLYSTIHDDNATRIVPVNRKQRVNALLDCGHVVTLSKGTWTGKIGAAITCAECHELTTTVGWGIDA